MSNKVIIITIKRITDIHNDTNDHQYIQYLQGVVDAPLLSATAFRHWRVRHWWVHLDYQVSSGT